MKNRRYLLLIALGCNYFQKNGNGTFAVKKNITLLLLLNTITNQFIHVYKNTNDIVINIYIMSLFAIKFHFD